MKNLCRALSAITQRRSLDQFRRSSSPWSQQANYCVYLLQCPATSTDQTQWLTTLQTRLLWFKATAPRLPFALVSKVTPAYQSLINNLRDFSPESPVTKVVFSLLASLVKLWENIPKAQYFKETCLCCFFFFNKTWGYCQQTCRTLVVATFKL
jgi:hypothetical protein